MQITSLQESHIEEVFQLSNEAFGKGFLSKDYLKQYISSLSKFGLVAFENKQFAGYVLIDNLSNEEFISEILADRDWFSEELKNHNPVSLIKQLAVSKQHQNKGIASRLIREILFQTSKTSTITYCLAWRKGVQVAIKNSLINNKFIFQRTIDNYWAKDSINKKYNCVYCGKPPCKCSLDVYIKKNASTNS